jgi:hypothetical protein
MVVRRAPTHTRTHTHTHTHTHTPVGGLVDAAREEEHAHALGLDVPVRVCVCVWVKDHMDGMDNTDWCAKGRSRHVHTRIHMHNAVHICTHTPTHTHAHTHTRTHHSSAGVMGVLGSVSEKGASGCLPGPATISKWLWKTVAKKKRSCTRCRPGAWPRGGSAVRWG